MKQCPGPQGTVKQVVSSYAFHVFFSCKTCSIMAARSKEDRHNRLRTFVSDEVTTNACVVQIYWCHDNNILGPAQAMQMGKGKGNLYSHPIQIYRAALAHSCAGRAVPVLANLRDLLAETYAGRTCVLTKASQQKSQKWGNRAKEELNYAISKLLPAQEHRVDRKPGKLN